MKVGILSLAHNHAISYCNALRKQGVTIAGITDENMERGRNAAQTFESVWYADYTELLKTDMDAVIICSENARHAEMCVAAAEAGKHILCEKPLAATMKDAERMIKSAEDNNVKLMTAFPCRFHPAAIEMKRRVAQGSLGELQAIQGTNRGTMPGSWFIDIAKSGGGAVLDHTVHVIDLMRWLMPGAEVKEVYAEMDTRFHDIPCEDCGLLTFEFSNGVIASLDPSWSRTESYPTWGDVTLEIVGTKGFSQIDLFRQNIIKHDNKTLKTSWANWGSDMDEGLIAEFIECIESSRKPAVTGEDGMKALEVALAAYESAEKRQPVRIAANDTY